MAIAAGWIEPSVSRLRLRVGVLVATGLVGMLGLAGGACGGNWGATFNGLGAGAGADGEAPDAAVTLQQDDSGTVALSPGDGGGGGPPCKGGLYTGTLTGTYTSSLTLIGLPVPVTGNLDITLEESEVGSEFPVYTIENGVISGLVYAFIPSAALSSEHSTARTRSSSAGASLAPTA